MALYNKMYHAARKDKLFMADLNAIEGDTESLPRFFVSNVKKLFYAGAYTGWLTGKYGPYTALEIQEKLEQS